MKVANTFDVLQSKLHDGTMSVESCTQSYLESIKKNSRLNAFLDVFEDDAIADARDIDHKLSNGTAGPLAGMVVAVKDIIAVGNKPTTCGSKMLAEYVSPFDATVVQRLKAADAVIIGKTNLDEFAMGSSNENSAFGNVANPIDETRVPGGSSGGSAVAVAAGLSTVALGTDTGGSIRQPAGFCGVIGLKPTYGRVSRYGLVAFASSFDQIGPFANSTRDIARVLNAIAGYDTNDSTTAMIPVPDYLAALQEELTGMRIGIPKEYFSEGLNREIRDAVEAKIALLQSSGAVIQEITLPHTEYTISTYYVLATAEASSNLARFDGVRYGVRKADASNIDDHYSSSRSIGFGTEVKRRIMLGTYVLSSGYYDAYYRKAQQVRRLIQNDFSAAFSQVDCIITPTAPTTAFEFGARSTDPLQMYLSDVYTVSANLAGIPGICVNAGVDHNGLPIGLQVLGKHFDESTIMRVADYIETHN